jgi:DNA-directed RNA polymerase beta' subunit
MKIIKSATVNMYNPDNVLTSSDIYSRKNELVMEDGVLKEVKSFEDRGLFSKRIFGDLNSDEEYSCQCGKYVGKFYEGTTCDKCNSEVHQVQANIDRIGWIDLNGNYIIKYISYSLLEKVIGRDNLKNIIHLPNKITMEGDIDEKEIALMRGELKANIEEDANPRRFWYIGLNAFYEDYKKDRTILKYYHKLNNYKEEKIYEFLEDVDDVFTDKIPVISTVLRPAMRTADGLKLDELNNIYINLLKNVEILNDDINMTDIIKDLTVEIIQAEYFQLSTKILDNIKSKGGLIRSQIMGTRINFSARNIISPAKAGYKIDEVVLPYLTFLNLYKYEIINILTKIKGINFVEAENIWFRSTLKIDQEIYMIMKKMIVDEEIAILLNRNPTISYGSILYMKVAGIKNDYEDMTMSIHNSVLTLLAGDFDGDVLNIISVKDSEMREVFKEVFSPISLIIDSNQGHFNTALNLERDQVLGLNNLLF